MNRKGKTYEEIFGVKMAQSLKKKRSDFFKKNNPGKKMKEKTYEEIYGITKGQKLKQTRNHRLGKKSGEYRVCLNCEKSFYVYPFAKNRKYCSNECRFKHWSPKTKGVYKKSIFKNCLQCGKRFRTYLKYEKIYCSKECYILGGKTKPSDKEKIKQTRINTQRSVDEMVNKIKQRGNRVLIIDKAPRPDIVEIDFNKKEVIGYEIETTKNNYMGRKILPYKKQFLKDGIVYDLLKVLSVDGQKLVWQKFPFKKQ